MLEYKINFFIYDCSKVNNGKFQKTESYEKLKTYRVLCGNLFIPPVLLHREKKKKTRIVRSIRCTACGTAARKFCKLVALLEQGECSASDEF